MNTQRRGVEDAKRRPVSILLAATALTAIPLAGCASRPADANLIGRPLPSNQDTAAAQAAARAAGGRAALAPPTPPVPPPSSVISATANPAWVTDMDAYKGLADLLIPPNASPILGMTPQQNPAASQVPPKPALEIITMPMWLWVEAPALSTTITVGAVKHTVTDQVVIDSVTWTSDTADILPVNPLTCGGALPLPPTPPATNTWPANRGAGTPYYTGFDPVNSGNTVGQGCLVSLPSTPQYSSTVIAGAPATTAAVITLTATTVNWHVIFTITDANNGNALVSQGFAKGMALAAPPVAPFIQFRIGEIQALVTHP